MRFPPFHSPFGLQRVSTTTLRAFSLLELVITIAVIGVIASLVAELTRNAPVGTKNIRLQSDVNNLNQMIVLYLADGGSLAGASTPQAVLDRLKRTRTVTDAKQHIGAGSGRFVDIRLSARMGSGALKTGYGGRAIWNASKNRFEISSGTAAGVDEFYLDEALASTDYGTESRRAGVMKFNSSASSSNGWVWGSNTQVPFNTKTPSYVDAAGTDSYFNPGESSGGAGGGGGSGGGGGGSGGGSGGGGSGGGGSGGGSGSPLVLPTPSISPSGGTFSNSGFPSSVTLNNNGAPPGQSRLEYQVNGGAWQTYSTPITIASADAISARNKTLDAPAFSDSTTITETYYQLVSDFSGGGVGSWGNVQGGSNLVQSTTNGDPTSSLSHGNTKLDLGGGVYLDAGVANELTFTKNDFATAPPNTWFQFGSLSMLNGTTYYDSEASGGTLTINLNLTQPASSGVVHVDLGFISTENNGTALENADIVELKNPSTDFTITIGGVVYRLELAWASLDPSTGVVQGNQFLIYEAQTAHAELRARFVPDH